jgi:hypothetical protein
LRTGLAFGVAQRADVVEEVCQGQYLPGLLPTLLPHRLRALLSPGGEIDRRQAPQAQHQRVADRLDLLRLLDGQGCLPGSSISCMPKDALSILSSTSITPITRSPEISGAARIELGT